MSVLLVGISHKSAPVSLLERVALDEGGVRKLVGAALETEHVREAVVLATCNRVEVYVATDRFHGSVDELSRLLAERAGARRDDVVPNLFVRYDEAAVAHLFAVAAGLDSMVVGETQVLGQARLALQRSQEYGATGPVLNALFQSALRVGKRAHAETDIDRAAPSLVATALRRAESVLGPLAAASVVVVGAGAMATLTASALGRAGAGEVTFVNRTPERATRLAASIGGQALPWDRLPQALAAADLVVSCTGATGVVISAAQVRTALALRQRAGPYVVVDLAFPRDVEPSVALSGVTVVDLAVLARDVAGSVGDTEVSAVRAIVAAEVGSFLAARSAAGVAPTVVALRTMATGVVEQELARLATRLPDLDPKSLAEVRRAVHRVADKLLHNPTVRVQELSRSPSGLSYADALAELFSLDPAVAAALTRLDPAAAREV